MQNKPGYKKILTILLVIILYLASGYYRDTFFKNLNSQIDVANGISAPFEFSAGFSFLGDLTAESLLRLKWIMTILFTLLFLTLGYLTIRIFLFDKNNIKLLFFAYGVVFMLAGIIMLTGKFINEWEQATFHLSRNLMHALQSPLIIMILVPVIMIMKKKSVK